MAEHKRGKMKNISGGVSDLICATNIFPLTRHVWPGPLQRVSCKKNMTVTGGVQSVLGMSWGRLGHFFDLKTPKKHFQKCQICPKQVGMDSQATFGVYLCQRRLCDVKKYPGF